jgi:hypothetical protein
MLEESSNLIDRQFNTHYFTLFLLMPKKHVLSKRTISKSLPNLSRRLIFVLFYASKGSEKRVFFILSDG